MHKLNISIFLIIFLLLSDVTTSAGQVYKVEVDGKKNCCGGYDHSYCSIEINLSQGKYIFSPVAGAISRWRDNRTAYGQGEQPWEWFLNIDVNGDYYGLGSQIRYPTKEQAFQEQQHERLVIEIKEATSVKIWVEDFWQGKNYCKDNRGKMIVKIEKLK